MSKRKWSITKLSPHSHSLLLSQQTPSGWVRLNHTTHTNAPNQNVIRPHTKRTLNMTFKRIDYPSLSATAASIQRSQNAIWGVAEDVVVDGKLCHQYTTTATAARSGYILAELLSSWCDILVIKCSTRNLRILWYVFGDVAWPSDIQAKEEEGNQADKKRKPKMELYCDAFGILHST